MKCDTFNVYMGDVVDLHVLPIYTWDVGRKHRCRTYTCFCELLSQRVLVSSMQCIQSFSPLDYLDIEWPPGISVMVVNNMSCGVNDTLLYAL
jgi:hypothetical protein